MRIRFGEVFTSRIGHLCYNVDNYLSSRRERDSHELAIFTRQERVANRFILSLWKRNKGLLFSQLARPAVSVLVKSFPDSPLLISFKKEMHPDISAYSATPPNVSLRPSERRKGEELLRKCGIEGPFICFHSRDSAYLAYHGGDGNFHDYRDFPFEDFSDGILRALDKGYGAIRLGEIVERPTTLDLPGLFSLTGTNRSDFVDAYLISEAAFFVGGNTGLSNVSRIFRKPELLVNYIPFRLADLSAWSAGSVLIPKKLFSKDRGRSLTFSEMAQLPYDIHYKGDFFGDRDLEVINNSPLEIADALSEMEARVTGSWTDSKLHQELQADFWASMTDIRAVEIVRDRLDMRIGSTFLERNPELI